MHTSKNTTQSDHPPEPPRRVVQVLALDDNAFDIQMVTRCLRGMKPWDVAVTGCESVEEALGAIQERDFELLFLDYLLPRCSGFEALAELRAKGFDGPTILMTGMQSETMLVEAMQAGVVDFLPKDALSASSLQRAAHNAVEKADLAKEVTRKSAELRETVTRLERRQEEIESFYHNVSHELKTPLTGSREFVSLVIDGAVGEITEDQSKLLQAALRGCDQMVASINNMLDASRLDLGKVALVPESVDLPGLLRRVVDEAEPAARHRQITLQLQVPEESVMAVVDPQRLHQAAAHLVGNAIKFSHPGGVVEVTMAYALDADWKISLTDPGCGVQAEDAPRIFDRLYQSSAQDAATLGGLGMGLYIAREVVELHAGSLEFVSEPGRGSTFTVSLPRCSPAPKPQAQHA